MVKYYQSIPTLVNKNERLERQVEDLQEENRLLKQKIIEYQREDKLVQTKLQESDDEYSWYVYFFYQRQIQTKLKEVENLNKKCTDIHHSLIEEVKKSKKPKPQQNMHPRTKASVLSLQNGNSANQLSQYLRNQEQNHSYIQHSSQLPMSLSKKESNRQKKEKKQLEKRKSQNAQLMQELNEMPPNEVLNNPIQNEDISFLQYINSTFPPEDQVEGKGYGRHQMKTKIIQKRKKQIDYSRNSRYLLHFNKPLRIKEFIKHKWTNFEEMNLCNAVLTTDKWQKFVQNANLYPNLKLLLLNNNYIENVTFDQLQKLKEVKYINLQGNPLTNESRQEIHLFQQKYDGQKKVLISDQ